ncbi:helix-turn-helix domain-containing protein [Virgibacillus soli]|uniref:Helix-turn-helix transcriptional regulator n=1 Tax=Paracerasibacillus soli TaxID=480284 RepID=A0ABU5CTD5_9BACI|nr:helix-turn-helix transcriptional regulator [Virgibacillus soli]MDY0409641.1 helix-turn-helix transcriptional regulator [Virgibacillus soli]
MISEKIKQLREERGLSPDQLAIHLQFAKSTIWSYEMGKREPSAIHLKKIADFFDVSTDYLLNRVTVSSTMLNLQDQDLTEKYTFLLDKQKITKEELTEAIAYIRAKRMMDDESISV